MGIEHQMFKPFRSVFVISAATLITLAPINLNRTIDSVIDNEPTIVLSEADASAQFQFVPERWLTLLEPGRVWNNDIHDDKSGVGDWEDGLVPIGRFGVDTGNPTNLVYQNQSDREESFIIKRPIGVVTGIESRIYNGDDEMVFRATYEHNRVVIEKSIIDTVYDRIDAFKMNDPRLDEMRDNNRYHLEPSGKKVEVYEKRLSPVGAYRSHQIITIEDGGDVLKFYGADAHFPGGEDDWIIKVTKGKYGRFKSHEGTIMEMTNGVVETNNVETTLSDQSFVAETVLRYGRPVTDVLNRTQSVRVKEAEFDQGGNMTSPAEYEQQSVSYTGAYDYQLGNFHVKFIKD